MTHKTVHWSEACSWAFVLLMLGCVTPQDAMENAERAFRKTEDIQAQHNALEERADLIEQNAKKLEQKIDADSVNGFAQVREALTAQETKNKEERDRLRGELNNRLDEVQKQMELLRTDLLNAIQSTNGTFVQKVDKQLASVDAVVGTMLLRIQELEKRLQAPRKK
jgi:hypothetical protein